MDRDELSDAQWALLCAFVPGGRKGKRGPRSDGRQFLNALLWMARSGARWRDLPERYGNYHTVKTRYYRWLHAGRIDKLFEIIAGEPDLEWISLDSTIIRAHPVAAGARRKRGDWAPRNSAARGAGSAQKSTPSPMLSACPSA